MTDEEKDIYDICLEKKSLYCIRRMGEETCDKCKTYKMYMSGLAEGRKENEELKAQNNKLRNILRKYEVVPDVDYLPNGIEIYKENIGDNPYGNK